jgi:hypothetical protein
LGTRWGWSALCCQSPAVWRRIYIISRSFPDEHNKLNKCFWTKFSNHGHLFCSCLVLFFNQENA